MKALLLALLLLASPVFAQTGQLTLQWDASVPDAQHPSAATGYAVKYGVQSGVYTQRLDAGLALTTALTGLTPGTTYYAVVVAYNSIADSDNSPEAFATAPGQGSGVPSPWIDQDIGQPALAGSATASTGTFTVTAGGKDIWDTSDQFHFVYQPMTGDGTIVAQIASLTTADNWSKAGVMMRADLTPGAVNALALISAANGGTFQWRSQPGAQSNYNGSFTATAPQWVKLARVGNLFTGSLSPDGTTWSVMGAATIVLPPLIQVGLAVTSHNPAATTTATLSNVSVGAATITVCQQEVRLNGVQMFIDMPPPFCAAAHP